MALLYVRNNADDGWEQINSSAGQKIYDADWDTRIECEATEDEDVLRFHAGGPEVGTWDATSLTMPLQPCFRAYGDATQTDFTINTYHEVEFNREEIDQGGDFNTGTYTFTAPSDGRYFFSTTIRFSLTLDSAAQFYTVGIITSNRDYFSVLAPKWTIDPNYQTCMVTTIANMDADDTAIVKVYQQGGGQQTDIYHSAVHTRFEGYKLC
jgi:hypothetical protein